MVDAASCSVIRIAGSRSLKTLMILSFWLYPMPNECKFFLSRFSTLAARDSGKPLMIDIHGLFDKNSAEEFNLDVTEVGNGRDRYP